MTHRTPAPSANYRKASATPQAPVAPYANLIADGESLLSAMHAITEDYCAALDKEAHLASLLGDADRAVDVAEANAVVLAVAAGKDGPLGSVAATSKAYGYAVTDLLAKDADAADAREALRSIKMALADAELQRKQAEARFSAVRYAARLKTEILHLAGQ